MSARKTSEWSLAFAGLICMGLTGLVTGCASKPAKVDFPVTFQQITADLRNAPVCCATPAAFSYKTLSVAGSVPLRIDDSSPAYEFESGKSYFQAFRFPAGREVHVSVRSRPVWVGSSDPQQFFFKPALLLLDEKFVAVKLVESGFTDYVEHDDQPFLEGTVAVDPHLTPYGIVLTTDKLKGFKTVKVSKGDMTIMPVATGTGMLFLPMAHPGDDKVYFHSEMGLLDISVR